jgi:hypothetical protein
LYFQIRPVIGLQGFIVFSSIRILHVFIRLLVPASSTVLHSVHSVFQFDVQLVLIKFLEFV